MHPILLLRRLFCLAALAASACVPSLSAQVADKAATVPVHFQALYNATNPGNGLQAHVVVKPLGVDGTVQWAGGTTYGGDEQLTQGGYARFRPGRVYNIQIDTYYAHRVEVKVTPPAGYRVFINDVEHEMFGWDRPGGSPMTTSPSFTLRLEDGARAEVGEASSLRPGRVLWSVGLGNLRNGKPAGSLRLAEDGLTASAFSPANLYYDNDSGIQENGSYAAANGEVTIVKTNGVLRQVYANTVLADIVPNAATAPQSYYIRLYARTQVGAFANGVYTVPATSVEAPLFEFFIENPTYPAVDAIRITKTVDQKPVNQNGPRAMWTQMTKQAAQPAGTTQWLVHDWVDKAGTEVNSPVRHRWTYTDNERNELLEIMDSADTVAQRTYKQYTDYTFAVPSGGSHVRRELTRVIAGDNGPSPVTTDYTYHMTFADGGNWGKVKTISSTGGSWTAFDYSNTFRSQGRLLQVRRPYKNDPISDPGLNPTTGEWTTYTYDFTDVFGSKILPTKVESRIDTKVVARSEISYAYEGITDASVVYTPSGHGDMHLTVATRKDYYSDTAYLTTVTRTYREDADWQFKFFPGLLYSIQRPDKTMTAMVYLHANFVPWDPLSGGQPTNPGVDGVQSGGARIHVALHGTSDTTIGTTMTPYAYSQPLPSGFRIVAGKSTQSRMLFNIDALPGISEQQAYVSGGNWVVTRQDWLSYTSGIWPSETSSRSGNAGGFWTSTQTWTKGRLVATVDETGVRHEITPDNVGRVQTILRKGATAEPGTANATTIADQTTTLTYDAVGRLRTQTMSTTTESLVTAIAYDTAGRVTSRSAPGEGATFFTYDVGQRTVTATLPTGSTLIEKRFADGQIASVEGTGTVNQHYAYEVPASDGRRKITVRAATSTSNRKRETWLDWLGRPAEVRRPGFENAQDFAEVLTYDDAGHLGVRARTGYANLHYKYNGMGQLTQQGLDLDATGASSIVEASKDRITEFESAIESHDGAYWLTSRTWAYHKYGTDDRVKLQQTRERLTGLSATLRGETRNEDAEANESRQTITVDPAKTVTVTTTRPGMANAAKETMVNGLPVYAKGFDGLEYRQTYDALGRLYRVRDPRTNTASNGTYSYWPNTRQPKEQRDARDRIVATLYYDAAGRVTFVKNAEDRTLRTAYTPRGEVEYRWGSANHPVSFVYDSYGQLTHQKTYRDPNDSVINLWETETWPAGTLEAATTEWKYDSFSGLLTEKIHPGGGSNNSTKYTYNERGQTQVRTWARNVTSTYDYFSGTGELKKITYNDGTPTVSYEAPSPNQTNLYSAYTRLGQPRYVSAGVAGQREFVYDETSPWRMTTEKLSIGTAPTFYGSRELASVYQPSTSTNLGDSSYTGHLLSGVKGRYTGYRLGVNPTSTSYEAELIYGDSNTGRTAGLVSRLAGVTTRQFVYGYESNSTLLKSLSVVENAFQVTRNFADKRDLVEQIATKWNQTVMAQYDYTHNDLGQRATVVQTGAAFADLGATHQRYGYNSRGELTSAFAYAGADPASTSELLSGRYQEYSYDWSGNRKTSNSSGDPGLADDYVADVKNQYTQRDNNTLAVSGTANSSARVAVGTANPPPYGGQGEAGRPAQGTFWGFNLAVNNETGPFVGDIKAYAVLSGAGAGGGDLFKVQTKSAWLPPAQQVFTYDDDGNLTSDGMWDYAWDAENRLKQMTTTAIAATVGRPNLKLIFAYDYLGRRVKKEVRNAANNAFISERRFVYDGWNVIAETDAGGVLKRSFAWGLDIAGSLGATGGVGALVQLHDYEVGKTMFPAYDGNGNLVALVNASSGTIEASYEYSPFGEILRATGAYAQANPFRFSTKWQDEESGLLYYGHRYYSPREGRFINRDPIEEAGGLNLYGFCGNDGINGIDVLGLNPAEGIEIVLEQLNLELEEFRVKNNERQYDNYIAEILRQIENLEGLLRTINRANRPDDIPGFWASLGAGLAEGGHDVATAFRSLPEGLGGLAGAMSVDAKGTILQVHDTITTNLANGYILATETSLADIRRDLATAADLYVNDREFRQGVTEGFAGTGTTIGLGGAIKALSPTGTELARRLGKAGEEAAEIVKNTERIPAPSGQAAYRIPDILDHAKKVVGDVKNVKELSYDSQLRDIAAYAAKKGYTFELHVRPTTQLSGPLQQAVANGEIVIKFLP